MGFSTEIQGKQQKHQNHTTAAEESSEKDQIGSIHSKRQIEVKRSFQVKVNDPSPGESFKRRSVRGLKLRLERTGKCLDEFVGDG